jgi:hypothetical protein
MLIEPKLPVRISCMSAVGVECLPRQLELAEQLRAGRTHMLEPSDLPGRFGRVIRAIEHVLSITQCESVLADGWAVWRHGYVARVTQDVDIVVAADRIDEFLRVAEYCGFERLAVVPGRWPKLRHKETDIQVDILPEGARPGVEARLAPTTIPHPRQLGASGTTLRYIPLPNLIELKLAAGRARDEADVIELLRGNMDQTTHIRQHLAQIHPDYVVAFDACVEKARTQVDQ